MQYRRAPSAVVRGPFRREGPGLFKEPPVLEEDMLVDTIAEAIWNEHRKIVPDAAASAWNDTDADRREIFLRYARAALNAVAVPTPEMLSQGNRALQAWDDSEHYRSPITGIYRAMISAELPPPAAVPREERYDEM
jgi:hypothetical protein